MSHVFDLYHEIPIKVALIEVSDSNGLYLSIVIHHIAFDGWSLEIFLGEWKSYYDSFLSANSKCLADWGLAPLSIQYKDFALWQRKYLTKNRLRKESLFWKKQLLSFEPLNLITDYPRPPLIEYRGDEVQFPIGSTLSEGLRNISKKLNVSLSTVFLSAYVLMLRIYSGQDDVIVGALSADKSPGADCKFNRFFCQYFTHQNQMLSSIHLKRLYRTGRQRGGAGSTTPRIAL